LNNSSEAKLCFRIKRGVDLAVSTNAIWTANIFKSYDRRPHRNWLSFQIPHPLVASSQCFLQIDLTVDLHEFWVINSIYWHDIEPERVIFPKLVSFCVEAGAPNLMTSSWPADDSYSSSIRKGIVSIEHSQSYLLEWFAPTYSRLGKRIDVWQFCVPDAFRLQQLKALLSPQELARATRFKVSDAKDEFVAGRTFLKLALAEFTGLPAKSLPFHTNEYGKPELCGAHSIHFNLSHSHGVLIAAISRSGPVGVDIELIRPIRNSQSIAASWFSSRECQLLESVNHEDCDREFVRLWTRKEAVLKAVGTGLSDILIRADVTGRFVNLAAGPMELPTTWEIFEIVAGPRYSCALAAGATTP